MRARYSAYATGAVDFLYESSGPEVRAEFNEETTREWSKTAVWKGLEILETEKGGENDEEGYVSFVARYAAQDKDCEHCESAYFKKIDMTLYLQNAPGKPGGQNEKTLLNSGAVQYSNQGVLLYTNDVAT